MVTPPQPDFGGGHQILVTPPQTRFWGRLPVTHQKFWGDHRQKVTPPKKMTVIPPWGGGGGVTVYLRPKDSTRQHSHRNTYSTQTHTHMSHHRHTEKSTTLTIRDSNVSHVSGACRYSSMVPDLPCPVYNTGHPLRPFSGGPPEHATGG